MVKNINIKSIKKVLLEEERFLNKDLKNEETIEFYNKAKIEIDNFKKNGTKIFQRKEIVFGEEEVIEVNIEQSLLSFSTLEISKAIVLFDSNPSNDTFSRLCNAYFLDLLTFIGASESFETSSVSYLESDIGLLYIFTMTNFPELLENVEPVILKGLEYRQKVRDSNIRLMPGSYGRDSILYLAYWIAKEYERSEIIANQLLSYCNSKIESCYIKNIENALSKNEIDVQNLISELAEYHIKNSKTSDLTYSFHKNQWIFYPIEILGLLKIRERKGFSNNFLSHPLINIFTPFLSSNLKIESDVLLLFNKFL